MALTRRRERGYMLGPLAVALALCVVYLGINPLTGDHAAQAFRTELFEQSGPVIWNNYWFGGHYLPGYSILSPALGAWLGFRLTAVMSVLGTVMMFSTIVEREWGRPAMAGAIWFAAAATISLFAGQATFALGVFLATATVFSAQRGWRLPSLLLAGSVALASPVAALFLACCGVAHAVARRPDRRGLKLASVSFATAIAISLLFPGGGTFPYVFSSFAPCFALAVLVAAVVPAEQKLIRAGLIVYAIALLLTFVIPTPMGGNVNRLGILLIGPLFLIAMLPGWRRHVLPLVILTPFILLWQFQPTIKALRSVDGDPATWPQFYSSLQATLDPLLSKEPARVEVVPVASHWESATLAPGFPLARGWERQTDRRYNEFLYEERLDPATYRRWLDRLAVGYVAVPKGRLDYAGLSEATLIRAGVSYLVPVPVTGPWDLYRVRNARPIVERPARLESMSTNGFEVSAPAPGTYGVRIRSTPYWEVTAGSGCVSDTPDGWTRVTLSEPGVLTVEALFRPWSRFGPDGDCRR